MKISCCVISNGGRGLYQMLRSVAFCDEIIIVNCEKVLTCDDPILLKKHIDNHPNIRTFYREWTDDFSAARNYSLSKARGDYIIIIDDDEILPLTYTKNIRELINKGIFDIIYCIQKSKVGEDFTTIQQPRIFRNIHEISYKNTIHNDLIYPKNCRICFSNIEILHNGYDLPITEQIVKSNRTLKIILNELKKEPNNLFQIYNAANTYCSVKNYDNALHYCRKFFNIYENSGEKTKKEKEHLLLMCYNIAAIASIKGNSDPFQAALYCRDGLDIKESYIDLIYIYSFSFFLTGQYDGALSTLDKFDHYRELLLKKPEQNADIVLNRLHTDSLKFRNIINAEKKTQN